jgi:hypothetical protein
MISCTCFCDIAHTLGPAGRSGWRLRALLLPDQWQPWWVAIARRLRFASHLRLGSAPGCEFTHCARPPANRRTSAKRFPGMLSVVRDAAVPARVPQGAAFSKHVPYVRREPSYEGPESVPHGEGFARCGSGRQVRARTFEQDTAACPAQVNEMATPHSTHSAKQRPTPPATVRAGARSTWPAATGPRGCGSTDSGLDSLAVRTRNARHICAPPCNR